MSCGDCCEHLNEITIGAHGGDGAIEKDYWCPDCGRRERRALRDKELKLPPNTVMR